MAIAKYLENGKALYRVDFRIGDKRPRKSGFRTEREALEFERMLKNAAGENISSAAVELDGVIVKYLNIVSVKKSKTLQGLEAKWFAKLSVYLKKVAKRKLLYEIQPIDLESYQAALHEHIGAGTVNRRFDSIKSLFKKCVEWRLLAESPTKDLKRLAHKSERRKTWRKDEIMAMHDALPLHFANLFYFIAMTGCRPGEARMLTWRDVDLKNGLVRLRSIKGGQGEMVRDFPLDGAPLRFMTNVRSKRTVGVGLVFPSTDGRHFDPASLQKKIKKMAVKLKLPEGLCVYGLRHSFTTALIEKDVSLEKVRLLVGHEKITTTQNYAHVKRESLREAALKYNLEEGLG